MRSNLYGFAGLLPVLLLAATLGSSGYDVPEEATGCRSGAQCKNQDKLAVDTSRRTLWARRLSLKDPSLLHFAKRHPATVTGAATHGQQFAPGGYLIVSPSAPPPSAPPPSAPPPSAPPPSAPPPSAPPPSAPAPIETSSLDPVFPPSATNFTFPADCRRDCPNGYTYTPPGAPSCGCVIPMHAQFRLGVKLEKVFPLVSELAFELADGLFLQRSQVRIVGANAVESNLEFTDVSADFVPLASKFDNTTSHLLASRLWSGQVPLNEDYFGSFLILLIKYPGLPPPPPTGSNVSPPGSANQLASGADKDNKYGSGLITVIALASAMGILLLVGFVWLCLLRRSLNKKSPPSFVGPLHGYFSPKPEGVQQIHLRMNAYFNHKPDSGSLLSESMASSTTLFDDSSMENCSGMAKTFSLSEIERATDHFRPDNVVGEGGFGRVYQGVLDSGVEVAVKVLTRDDRQGGREFIAEVEMLSRLHHRNLVKLIGICTEEIRCLVYELITNGSLESHLHGLDKYTAPLNWDARVKIALGSARGLAYLHEDSQPRVIHRDFKGSNILLEDDFTPKVSDFGLAKSAAEEGKEHISTRVMGTFGYVAPEYAMTGHLLAKSDVYSYGVVLLELLSGRKPVDMSQPPGQENLVTWARPLLTSKDGIQQVVDPCLGDRFPFDSFAKVAAIASMCVQPEVSHRPFMGEVVQALKLVYNELKAGHELNGHHGKVVHGSSPDLVQTQTPQFLNDASFISIDYDSGPLGSDLNFEQRLPLSASADLVSSPVRLFRQLSGSFQRFSASAPPPKASSLPRGAWCSKANSRLHSNIAGSMSEHSRAPSYLHPPEAGRRPSYGL